VLPCALALWASAIVLRTGSLRALLAGGVCVGLAASFKYSDGAVAIALATVVITNPYLIADWSTFIHDLDRQRKFASGRPLIGQPERNGWLYYVASMRWALGIVPCLLALAGGIVLLVRGRRREAIVLGAFVVLYWLYMGSQSRFYMRWMLPLFPALAILAGYACAQVRQRAVFAVLVALALVPAAIPTIRNAIVLGREDTRTQTREWLIAHVPAGTKVVFEPIAPREWYGVTPGGGPKADPRDVWDRFHRNAAMIAKLKRKFHGAGTSASFQSYEFTLTPLMLPIYRRGGYCWIVTGSTQYGRGQAEPHRVPKAMRYYRALRRQADVMFRTTPADPMPRYQVDRSFNYVDAAYHRPGPEMIVYRLKNCS
jgi:hypothetical protein